MTAVKTMIAAPALAGQRPYILLSCGLDVKGQGARNRPQFRPAGRPKSWKCL